MWTEFFNLTIPPVVAVALLGPLLKIYIEKSLRRHEEKARQEAAVQLEEIKSSLSALRNREEFLFSTLHTRRVEKISSLALVLFEIQGRVQYIVATGGATMKEQDEYYATLQTLRDEFKALWLLIPRSFGEQIHALIADLDLAAHRSFQLRIEPGTDPKRERITLNERGEANKHYRERLLPAYEQIEAKFREMLFVEPQPAMPRA